MDARWGSRAGVAAFALGVSLAAPAALNLGVGLAAADTHDTDAAGPAKSEAARPGRDAAAAGAPRPAAGVAAPRSAAAESPVPARESAAGSEPARASARAGASADRNRAAVRPAPSVVVAVPAEGAPAPAADSRAADVAVPAAETVAASSAQLTPAPAAVAAVPASVPPAEAVAAAAVAAPAPGLVTTDVRSRRLPATPVADFVAGAMLLARRTLPGSASAAVVEPAAVTVLDPNQHVLLIGVDGTNLSAILADDYNQAFFDLMDTGTTAVATMVGHTTISNPSWTGILTGVWSETAGVSNNVFTPWTYDTWPTVFNQLETLDPSIATTVIGDWEVIAQIAGAGSVPADTIVFYPQINDSWLETDDAVGARSIEAIQNTVPGVPSFQMTYFVGVDDTGHDTYGAGSPEYAEALRNVNDNIADIMAAVDAWEAANPGEEWTVIAVTDHGQVLDAPLSPLLAGLLAHGFQSPLETTVWVIADGPDFADGHINNTYSQVDITPTILRLFGYDPEPYSAGVPLMDKFASDYLPAIPGQASLKNALSDAIDMYGYPDVTTDLALAIRTLVATVPYFVYTAVEGITAGLPEFLALPIKFIGAIIYQLVNIPAQLIVRLTGVTGNQIIPPQLWPYNPVPGTQPVPPTAAVPVGALAV